MEEEFLIVFKKEFPNIDPYPWRYGNNEQYDYTHFVIPPVNRNLLGSNYFENKQKDFYHFTTLDALQSIITSKTLRLYNLANSDDPREYLFGANYLHHEEEQLDDAKKNFFILSMCGDIEKMKNTVKFNMWRLYGENGNGCILKISINNDPVDWHNFYMSKVHYGNRNVSGIRSLGKLLELINNKRESLGIDMGQLLCFHKSYLYNVENEYRLLFDMRKKKGFSHTTIRDSDNEVIFPIIRSKISSNYNPNVSFLELPILGYGSEPVDTHIPWITIRQIILGYKLKEHYKNVRSQLRDLYYQNFGFVPSIVISDLSKQFYGD